MIHLVISDTHIGDRQSNKNLPKLFTLLEDYSKKENCNLVLNGDIFDFAKTLAFDERHRIFLSLIQKYENVTYIEGNHDWFVSGLRDVLPISFKKCVLLKLENKIIRISHGHQTDRMVMNMPKLNRFLVKINSWFHDCSGIDVQHAARKTWLVQKLLLQRQENRLIRLEKVANVVIAGHTHRPCEREYKGIMYYNTGDWVEKDHCSYVTISDNSNIELFRA